MSEKNQQLTISNTPIDQLLSLTEASQQTGISVSHLRNLLSWGKLKGRKLGNNWYTTKADVETYLALGNRPGPKPQNENAMK